ncbi:hypothetical protein PTSG_11685 [Salpingoeca rosetta]|uniref:NWD1/2-like winged helix-turn-helix domain-containing protein n=1 Tax=Salpingoeca rosetta (strain ATCC 50818 / BSB-021) TaxID=946362 RepID=F2TYB5_SALR5|nr:uncharacterized protein PTSG_11685 [Salpingoeca rosetta]EGD76374.1 hypothetical protein PTSG_11685 [Salpingoeca rosetta]|eukprot:XP_004998549.1 hypothetical protein PTSG_11685 [Salpingoeca rosetta]
MSGMAERVLRGAVIGDHGSGSSSGSGSSGSDDVVVEECDRRAQATISVFVYANHGEFDQELAALHHKTFPALRSYAQELGLNLEVLDASFCAGTGDSADPEWFQLAQQHLHDCKHTSNGPYFVGLLGQHLGKKLLPTTLSKTSFEHICQEGTDDQVLLLRSWYKLDENANPPTFALQSVQEKLSKLFTTGTSKGETSARTAALGQWMHIVDELGSVIARANEARSETVGAVHTTLQAVLNEAVFMDASPRDCIIACRQFKNLDDHLGDAALPQYVHVRDGTVDSQALQDLSTITTRLKGTLDEEDLVIRTIAWSDGCGVQPKDIDHRNYIKATQAGVDDCLRTKIEHASRTVPPRDAILAEVVSHARFTAAQLALPNCHAHVLDEAHDAIKSTGVVSVVAASDRPVLAARIAHAVKRHTPSKVVCVRYCGLTAQSSSLHGILFSICQQVGRVLGRNTDAIPHFTHQLPTFLHALLKEATATSVAVVLDDIAAIATTPADRNTIRHLLHVLAPVAVVVLVSDEEVAWLKSIPTIVAIKAAPMPRKTADEVIEQRISAAHRTLSRTHRQAISNGLNRCTAPLYVRLAAEMAVTWKSTDSTTLATTPSQMVKQFLERIEKQCGQVVTAACFSYVALSRFGLLRQELLDVLSLDNEALRSCDVSTMPAGISRFPFPRLARWLAAASPLLAVVDADGGRALRIATPEVAAAITSRYLRPAQAVAASRTLRDYWASRWAAQPKPTADGTPTNRLVPEQPLEFDGPLARPNMRALHELPHVLKQCGDLESLDHLVCFNYNFLRQFLKHTTVEETVGLFNVPTSGESAGAAASSSSSSADAKKQAEARQLVARALSLSDHVLATEPDQLACQLIGRLQAEARHHADIQVLLEQASKSAQESRINRCVPTVTCMATPHNAPKLLLSAHEHISGIACLKSSAVVASERVQFVAADGTNEPVVAVDVRAHDALAVFASLDRAAVLFADKCLVLDAVNGGVVATIEHGGYAGCFTDEHNGALVIVNDESITRFDAKGKQTKSLSLTDHVESVCASSDHVLAVTDDTVLLWPSKDSTEPKRAELPAGTAVHCLSTSRVFMLKETPSSPSLLQAVILSVAVGDDGDAVALKEMTLPLTLPHDDFITAFSSSSTAAVIASHNTAVLVHLPSSGESADAFAVRRVVHAPILPAELEQVAVDDEERIIAATDDGHVYMYDSAVPAVSTLPTALEALAFSDKLHNGSFCLSSAAIASAALVETSDGRVLCADDCAWKLLDATSLDVQSQAAPPCEHPVIALCMHKRKVLSLHADRLFRLWTLDGELIETSESAVPDTMWPLKAFAGGPSIALLSRDGRCCTVDGDQLTCRPPLQHNPVAAIRTTEHGLVVGAGREVVVVVAEHPVVLGQHDAPVNCIASNDSTVISASGTQAKVWDLAHRSASGRFRRCTPSPTWL